MNLIKGNTAPAPAKRLSLDVFKDKMMAEVHETKGAGSTAVCTWIIKEVAEKVVETLLDNCHD